MKRLTGNKLKIIRPEILSIILILILSTSIFTWTVSAGDISPLDEINPDEKISEMLSLKIAETPSNEKIPAIIILKDQTNGYSADDISQIENSQKGIMALLEEKKSNNQAQKIKSIKLVNAIAVEATPEVLTSLANRPDVLKVELDEVVSIAGYPTPIPQETKASASTQEITTTNAWGVDKIGAPAVWQQGINGEGILVAVVDTGIDATHPDLDDLDDNPVTNDPKLVGWIDYVNGAPSPYDDHGHGTHVSGTISGTGANSVQTGVAPGTQLIAAKVFNSDGWGYTSDIILAFEWAVDNNADIISFSGGGSHESVYTTTINNVVAAGVVPVVAAGNEGPGASTVHCPGDEVNSLTVGATDSSDIIAWFSSRGPVTLDGQTYIKPDVSAPGVSVTSTLPGGGYAAWDGTSMATPHVSGTAALMLENNPDLSPAEVKQTLEDTARDLGVSGKDNDYGSGRINAYEAVFGPQSNLPKVAIYVSYGEDLRTMLLANGYQAEILSEAQIETGELAQYDVFVYGHDYGANSQTFKDAVVAFVTDGGGLITEWSSSAVLLSEIGPNVYPCDIIPYGMFDGFADYGGYVGTNTPIDILDNAHPIFEGVADDFAGEGSTEFFYTSQDLDPRLNVIAEYDGHGGTWPAIAVADGAAPSYVIPSAVKNPYSVEKEEITQWEKRSAQLAPLKEDLQARPSAVMIPIIYDPAGDNVINEGPIIDIIQVDGGSDDLTVSMNVVFSNPMDTENTVGVIYLDTDQNPFTGNPPDFCDGDIGVDYQIELWDMPYDGTVTVWRTSDWMATATVPVEFGPNNFEFTIPLSALDYDDGNIDVDVVVGDYYYATDCAPDFGHGTIGETGEPVEPPVLESPEASVIPVIDGVFSPDEWEDANVVTATKIYSQAPDQGKVYVKNSNDTLFVLIDHYAVEGTSNDVTGDIWFDLFNDGTFDGGFYTEVWDGEVYADHDFAATYAVANGATQNNPSPHWVFEYAIPLNQFPEFNNIAIDFVLFDYLEEGGEWPNPTSDMDNSYPEFWADLNLSAATPPSPQESSNIVMFFFDAWDEPAVNEDMVNLWLNSINYVAEGQPPEVPDISIDPASLAFELPQDAIGTRTLTIQNTGEGVLNFEITDSENGAVGQPSSHDYPAEYYFTELAKGEEDTREGQPVIADYGGPDAFGYSWIDSDEPGGPVFDYIDISDTGTLVTGLSDDNQVGPFPIEFNFPFYENTYSQFYISSNGVIEFENVGISFVNYPIPSQDEYNNLIAWCWDDLYCRSDSYVYYESFGDKLVIQFVNYGEFGSEGRVNAEVILYPDGRIVYQYANFLNGFDTLGSTVGIENAYGTDGLEVAFETPYLHDSLAVEFSLEGGWLSESPVSGTVAPGTSMTVDVTADTSDLTAGSYSGEINIWSNDPDEDPVIVPVDLTVTGGSGGGDILFDAGHGNTKTPDYRCTIFADALEQQGYTVDVLGGAVTPEILAAYDVFISSTPENGFTQSEITYIQQYIENGGSALLIGEWGNGWGTEYLAQIVAPYGITPDPNCVYQPNNCYYGYDEWPIITQVEPPIQNVESYVEYAGSSISVNSPAQAIAWTDADAYVATANVLGEDASPERRLTDQYEANVIENVLPMVAISEPYGKVAYVGDSSVFCDVDSYTGVPMINEFDNKELALSLVAWLAGGESSGEPDISVSPSDLYFELPQDAENTQTLTIQNTGDVELSFEIADSEIGATVQDVTIQIPASTGQNNEGHTATSAFAAEVSGSEARTIELEDVRISNEPIDVLLVGADYSADSLTSILTGFPDIGAVNFFNAADGTPTLAELQQYDVAIVWSNAYYYDKVALGNVLADYVDCGGKVIIQVGSWYGPDFDLQGRIITDGYSPFVQDGDNPNHYSTAYLGWYDEFHPIMTGVNTMSDELRDSVVLTSEAELVAEWDDGEEFIATKGPVVGINSWPGDGHPWTGDYPTIVHNTILWITGQTGDEGWLSESPISGTVAPGTSLTVDVTADTSDLAIGDYGAEISIWSNDPDENPVIVPVYLTVTGEPDGPIVYVNPDYQEQYAGSTFTVDINVDPNSSEVYAGQYELHFDPAKFEALGQTQGSFLTQDGADSFVIYDTIDNVNGVVSYGEMRVGAQNGGVTVPGTLASIEFLVKDPVPAYGDTVLDLMNVVLSDTQALPIPGVAVYDGIVNIPENQPPVAYAGEDILSCENVGFAVNLDGSGSYDPDGSIVSYEWDFGDGTTGTGANPVHTYTSANYEGYTVTLTVTDENGAMDSDTVTVVVWIAGDANGDAVVNILDAAQVGLHWGETSENPNFSPGADLNNDDVINILDAAQIGLHWGETA